MSPAETDNPAGETRAGRSRLFVRSLLVDSHPLASILRALRSGRFVIPFWILSGLTLAIYQEHREPAIYDASAEILLRPVDASALTLVYSGTAKKTVVSLPTEAQILLSDTVLGRVAKELDLAKDPRFAHTGSHLDDNQPQAQSVIAELRDGLSVSYDTFRSDDSSFTGKGARKTQQPSGPRIIYLSFSGPDPEIAAAIVKSEIKAYADRNFELRRDAVMRISARLTSSMDDFKKRIESEQRTLFEAQRRTGMIGLAGDRNPDATELFELTRQSALSQMQVRAAQVAVNAVKLGAGGRPEDHLPPPTANIRLLQSEADLVQLQLAELATTLGTENPSVRQLQARKSQLLLELAQSRERSMRDVNADLQLARSQSSLTAAATRQKASVVNAELDDAAQATTLQVQLQRDSELYYVLVNNVRTAEIDAGYGSVGVTILKQPDVPEKPRPKSYLARSRLYGIAGLMIGFLLAFLLAYVSDAALSKDRDLERVLRMPTIAEIPWANEARKSDSSSPLILTDPGLKFCQAIFSLRDTLRLAPAASGTKRIVFAGAASGQGTTTIAINTAIAMAKADFRVLLVDANLQKPSIHRRLRLEARKGLTTALDGQSTLEESTTTLRNVPRLDVLVSGPVASPGAVISFGSPQMRFLLEWGEEKYDYILIDAGVPADLPDTTYLLEWADLALLVARTGEIGRSRLSQAGTAVRNSCPGLVGFIRCAVNSASESEIAG